MAGRDRADTKAFLQMQQRLAPHPLVPTGRSPDLPISDRVGTTPAPCDSWIGKEVIPVVDKKKGKDKRKDPILKKKEDGRKEKSK